MINTPARPIARPSQYSAILFDCDGVLVPNNPLLTPEQLLQAGAVAVIGDVRELAQHW